MRAVVCFLLLVLFGAPLLAQSDVYICPMDPDVRSNHPGFCPRCGMKMRQGIPDPVEYHMDLTATPQPLQPNQPARLDFTILDPWKNRIVKNFQVVHEKLFHMFAVSQDLQFFVHDHPILTPNGDFYYNIQFPKPGMYRILSDFYPDGATPQLITKTVLVPGSAPAAAPAKIERDYSAKDTANMRVELTTDPPQPLAHMKTLLYFHLSPADGIEKYLGSWAHLLAASDDLIDMIHTHPFIATGSPDMEFSVYFPRARTYRIWVQFQRKGVVNTARFDIPVGELK